MSGRVLKSYSKKKAAKGRSVFTIMRDVKLTIKRFSFLSFKYQLVL
jgi:hypothetical protein